MKLPSSLKPILMTFLILLALGVLSREATTAELITVDLDSTLHQADAIASGWTSSLLDEIPDSLVTPLKPSFIRFAPGNTNLSQDEVWGILNSVGGVAVVEVPWALHTCPNCNAYGSDDCPGCYVEPEDDCWVNRVLALIDTVEARHSQYPYLEVHYDIYNEPDVCPFWTGTDTQFFELFDSAVDSIRARDSGWGTNSLITGPTLAGGVEGYPEFVYGDVWGVGIRMQDFLNYCDSDSMDCLPDILGWHRVSGNAHGFTLRNIYDQVAYAADSLTNYGISQFEINEMMGGLDTDTGTIEQLQPGTLVRHFALAERAVPLGLRLAGRTIDPPRSQNGEIGGLVGYDDGSSSWKRRNAWWTQKSYADLSGNLVYVQEMERVDGLASWEPADSTIRFLGGSFDTLQTDTLVVRFRKLRELPGLVINDVVQFRMEQVLGDSSLIQALGSVPTVLYNDERRLVFGDSLDIAIPNFDTYDSIYIEIYPIAPSTVPAPGED